MNELRAAGLAVLEGKRVSRAVYADGASHQKALSPEAERLLEVLSPPMGASSAD